MTLIDAFAHSLTIFCAWQCQMVWAQDDNVTDPLRLPYMIIGNGTTNSTPFDEGYMFLYAGAFACYDYPTAEYHTNGTPAACAASCAKSPFFIIYESLNYCACKPSCKTKVHDNSFKLFMNIQWKSAWQWQFVGHLSCDNKVLGTTVTAQGGIAADGAKVACGNVCAGVEAPYFELDRVFPWCYCVSNCTTATMTGNTKDELYRAKHLFP